MAELPYVHEQPCACTNCEGVRHDAFKQHGPGLYKAIARAKNYGGGSGTTTWTLDRFEWGEGIPAGTPIWVERLVAKPEHGYHIHGAVIWVFDGDARRFAKKSRLCTSVRWLEPL